MLLNTPEVITPQQTRRPGWPEILVGVAVMALLCYALPFGLGAVGVTDSWSDTTFGLFVAALSGVAGLAAFWAAARLRNLDWSDLGVRPTTKRWIFIGIASGLAAVVLARIAAVIVTLFTGPPEEVQGAFSDAAGDGIATLVLSFIFLAVLTPIGEEFLFRGVVATALLRYGALAGVLGSA